MERKIADGAERKELHRIVLFVLAFVVTIVCIGTGSIQQRETVQVGSVATKRYVAPEDTVDEAATEKLAVLLNRMREYNPALRPRSAAAILDELETMALPENGTFFKEILSV